MGNNNHRHPLEYYTPAYTSDERGLSQSEQISEYRRLRKIAMDRLRRIRESEYGDEDPDFVNELMARFKRFDRINTESELRALLSEVSKWVSNPMNTLSGWRDRDIKRRESIRESTGLVLDSVREMREFADFMEEYRNANLANVYGSKSVVDYYIYKQDRGEEKDATLRGYIRYQKRRMKEREKDPETVKRPKNKRVSRETFFRR